MTKPKFSIFNSRFSNLNSQRGSVLISLLITAATFSIIIYSLLAVLASQFDFSFRQTAHDQSLNIAEAGTNYYLYHLIQDPTDFQDGTGGPGPYVHDYRDPQGSIIGQFSLEITPPEVGSSIVTVKSTAWTTRFPDVKQTVVARFGQSSYASFAFLSNASLWLGTGITVNGKVHTNTGIRQDGINTSTVASAKETYKCGKETGCSPTQDKPGVWGIGEDKSLWDYPVPAIDFDAISYDFGQMRSAAQTDGVYMDRSGKHGYHVVFNASGTVDIYRVNSAQRLHGWSADEGGCARRRQIVTGQNLLGTYNVADTPIIFLEDTIWVSGVVNGRVTLVAARFPISTSKTNIWIYDNVTYLEKDGNHALGLIANNDIYFARDIPDDFEINAALLAQQGRIMRHGYLSFCGSHPNAVRNSLSIYGALIPYQKPYWNFGTAPDSGFRTRTITFDLNLSYNPPPYYPSVGGIETLSWQRQ